MYLVDIRFMRAYTLRQRVLVLKGHASWCRRCPADAIHTVAANANTSPFY